MKKEVIKASLRLFNALPTEGSIDKGAAPHRGVLERTLAHGYLLPPGIAPSSDMLECVEDVVGISGEKANASFHKSWAVIRDSSETDLRIQQMLHYITTYGFEALGIYDKSTVYFPDEVLELPEGTPPVTVIQILNYTDMYDAIVRLGGSGIALHEDTLNDLMLIVENHKFAPTVITNITNRELKARLMDFYGLVPTDPVEFLRHIISKLTNESLIIKNEYMITKIKESSSKHLDDLMKQAPENLGSIFLRYKPLFLAMRSISKHKSVFNKLRKDAVKMHKPLPEDVMGSVTMHLKNGKLKKNALKKALSDASLFRKIRLAYALQYRMVADDSIVYQVRSGRGWATGFSWDTSLLPTTEKALRIVLESIAKTMEPMVHGKKVLVPGAMKYAIPATEKQFVGNIPSGSYISVDKDLIVGVYWNNVNGNRIDLDLASMSIKGKIGWDSAYRNNSRSAMFSGDVTDPGPKGASELFYFAGDGSYAPQMFTLNYYNYNEDLPVPMKLFVASERVKTMKENYMVDVSNIVASVTMKITEKQNILGLYMHIGKEKRFYFHNTAVGKGISSLQDENTIRTRKFLETKMMNPLILNDILEMAGADIITERPVPLESPEVGMVVDEDKFIDLSPEALTKSTIIDLLLGE